ncbi:SH3 domain-containing protein [Ciceribacter sp. L1K22]|uniref:SH3 domain-containing protein n=1 Tax=Ciceribacter sp. L1K22 TaxID=2820275 RepID=UPI001ABDD835|nr:SH3 domain-containing protein [Ciceribacter sp. L1K22]MBO3762347.1 SH3 domain-containing protein [Ciceribacter sp. L1K22]
MKRLGILAAGLAIAVSLPALAQAANGYATANVNLRAGPSTNYPAVTVIPAGAGVDIYGCLNTANWCDVGFRGIRGWVSGSYLQAGYQQRRVYVAPEYYRPLGIPTVTFSVGNYWDRHYRGRDFYRNRDRWDDRGEWRQERREERRDWREERREDRRDDRRDWREERRDDRRDAREERRDNRPDAREERREERRDNAREQERRQETRENRRQQTRENSDRNRNPIRELGADRNNGGRNGSNANERRVPVCEPGDFACLQRR